jgi:hypothetical protein
MAIKLYSLACANHGVFTYTQEPMAMKCEVRKALREITGNKATGADELPIELVKAAGDEAITGLLTDMGEHFVAPRVVQIHIFTSAEKKDTWDCVPITEPLH